MKKQKKYKILKSKIAIQSTKPGKYAVWGPEKIFGRLDCVSGIRIKKEHKVFFHSLNDTVRQGFRPCRKCNPITEKEYKKIQHLVPECSTMNDFCNKK